MVDQLLDVARRETPRWNRAEHGVAVAGRLEVYGPSPGEHDRVHDRLVSAPVGDYDVVAGNNAGGASLSMKLNVKCAITNPSSVPPIASWLLSTIN